MVGFSGFVVLWRADSDGISHSTGFSRGIGEIPAGAVFLLMSAKVTMGIFNVILAVYAAHAAPGTPNSLNQKP